MPNGLLTTNMITRSAVSLFKNSNAFIQNINTQYDGEFGVEGAKIGNSVRIRLPNDYVPTEGPGLSVQDTNEQFTTLTLTNQTHVDVAFTSAERTLSIDDYEEIILAPMLNNLAGRVAANVMSGVEGGVCNAVFNQDGSGNTIAPTRNTVLKGGAALSNNSAAMMNRKLITTPDTMANVVDTLAGLFNPTTAISQQYETAQMYKALNFLWFEDQTTLTHTTGTFSAGTVNGAGQVGTSLVVNAITGTLKKGDIITVALTNGVNRVTKQSWAKVRQFVVTANVASGATSIPIYPAIIPGGVGYDPVTGIGAQQYQTVDVSPANSAVISLANKASETYRKNIGYTREAITMATAPLVTPNKGVVEARRSQKDGISMRMITDYAIGTDQLVTRLDVLYGWLFVRPEWAVVIADSIN